VHSLLLISRIENDQFSKNESLGLYDLFRDIEEEISHRLAEVLEISSRVTVLRDGKLVGVYPTEGMTQSRLTELMTGTSFAQDVMARDPTGSDVLRVEDLSRAGEYEGVSFTLRGGEVLGLTGLIGAGRTELCHTLFGMTQADRGRIILNGRELNLSSNRDAVAKGIAYVSEDRLALGLIQPQSISDNTVLAVLRRITGG
ncbi:MAG: ATP-binding cassette domain-containing protein, partial [Pseudomonadota bacterium]